MLLEVTAATLLINVAEIGASTKVLHGQEVIVGIEELASNLLTNSKKIGTTMVNSFSTRSLMM